MRLLAEVSPSRSRMKLLILLTLALMEPSSVVFWSLLVEETFDFRYLKVVGVREVSSPMIDLFFLLPPLILATNTHSIPKNLQLEQTRGWSGPTLFSWLFNPMD